VRCWPPEQPSVNFGGCYL